MTRQEIQAAIDFLSRLFVGPAEVDRLEQVIKALKAELTRRTQK
jgi:hypothetical protein